MAVANDVRRFAITGLIREILIKLADLNCSNREPWYLEEVYISIKKRLILCVCLFDKKYRKTLRHKLFSILFQGTIFPPWKQCSKLKVYNIQQGKQINALLSLVNKWLTKLFISRSFSVSGLKEVSSGLGSRMSFRWLVEGHIYDLCCKRDGRTSFN